MEFVTGVEGRYVCMYVCTVQVGVRTYVHMSHFLCVLVHVLVCVCVCESCVDDHANTLYITHIMLSFSVELLSLKLRYVVGCPIQTWCLYGSGWMLTAR